MKNTFTLVSACMGMLLFFSCSESKSSEETAREDSIKMASEYKLVTIHNEYSISLPEYLKEGKDLNDDASLQYMNTIKNAYIIVIDEDKDTMLNAIKEYGVYNDSNSVAKNYRDTQLALLAESMVIKSQSPSVTSTINGLNAEAMEIIGRVEGIDEDIAYFFTFIEGPEKMYMVMAWTMADKQEKYRETFAKAVNTFKGLSVN